MNKWVRSFLEAGNIALCGLPGMALGSMKIPDENENWICPNCGKKHSLKKHGRYYCDVCMDIVK